MKSRVIFNSGCVLAACLTGTALLTAAEAAPAKENRNAPPEAAATRTKPVLDKGLTAEQVEKLVGKPTAIKPMDAPAGSKAEMWIYRRKAATNTRQVEIATSGMAGFVGHGMEHLKGDVSVPEYQVENTILYQITALLMVDGKLVLARQWKETERNFTK